MTSRLAHLIARSLLVLPLIAFAAAAEAECYADYKAKMDDPLRLHYGVIEVSDAACGDRKRAAQEVRKRIRQDGWELLNVMSTFGPEGLAQRKSSAGEYFLRY